jgi:hypothetical protein
MTNIQNTPNPTKVQSNKLSKESVTKCLATNSTYVEQHPKPTDNITVRKNRINFLKDKNTGKKLWTRKEISTFEKSKKINKTIQKQNKTHNLNILLKPLKQPKHTFCGCRVNTDHVSIETKTQINSQNKSETKNFITGNAQCKDIWRCPSCSMKLLKGRAIEVVKISAEHEKQGYKLGFVTLTIRHDHENTFKESLDKLLNNYRKIQQHSFFRKLNKNFLLGQVKALETTYSQLNGFHPHLHILFLYKSDSKEFIEFCQKKLIQDWATYTGGLVKSQDQQVVYSKDGISKYLTKWDVAQELTNDHNKTGKGVKPFQLLTKISNNEFLFENQLGLNNKPTTLQESLQTTKSLWLEYVETIKGKRRIIISKKILDAYKIKDKTDEEIVTEKEKGTKIISFSKDTWNIIYQNNLQPQMLYICDSLKNPQDQHQHLLQYLQNYADVYLDDCKWDQHRPNGDNQPIIRLTKEKQKVNAWHNFIENRLISPNYKINDFPEIYK